MKTKRSIVLMMVLILVSALGNYPIASFAAAPADPTGADGDGYPDLAVGVEWEDVGSIADAGAVNILYGSSSGISAAGDQIWVQDNLVATDGSEANDYFGQKLVSNDFNGDGTADLAAGVPGEDIGTAVDGGAVHVLYGSDPSGLQATGNQLWHQGSPGIAGAVESGDRFGAALASGDFDGDGYADLAVGAPDEDIEPTTNAGAVNILYGSSSGLTATGNQIWYEGYNGLGGSPETGDWFGYALSASDFNHDGYDDLAISLPGEDLGGVNNAGRVVIIFGSPAGLSSLDSQAWVQGLNGVLNNYETDDYFGKSLTAGNFNGDAYADLAIGVPDEDNGVTTDTGAVNVLFGSENGLTATGNQIWFDTSSEEDDEFGRALAAGDFNGDGFDELAVGIPYEDLVDLVNTGAVEVLYGASGGLIRRVANDFWHQDRSNILDWAEEGDLFGVALAAGNFDSDDYVDLAIGVRNEDVGTIVDTGAVQILYGSVDGISATGNQFWHQDSQYIEGGAETNDHFGCALVALNTPQLDDNRIYLPFVVK